MILLSWRGPCLANGQRERVDVNAKDGTGSSGNFVLFCSNNAVEKILN